MTDAKYSYDSLKKSYSDFMFPMISVVVGGKNFSENKHKLIISDMCIDLSTGFEASVATFSIYNTYNRETGQYELSKFKQFVSLGSSVSISIGYSDRLTEIFVGFISSVQFINGVEPHHVEVTAMDVKGIMMAGQSARQLMADNYKKAIEEIFQGELYQKLQSLGIYTTASIAMTPDATSGRQQNESIEIVSESDYEFVVKAAKRFNYEFYIECGKINFRKAKDTAENCLIELQASGAVKDYTITYDMTGLVKKVEVRGMDVTKGMLVTATASTSNKISTGNKAKSLISHTSRVVIDAGVTSKEAAQYRADSVLEDISYRFGSLECDCIGLPELMPGHFIRITDLGEPCNTDFYVTHTRHIINDHDGYHTQITAKAATLV